MNYYIWCNGYENAGIVKADSLDSAKHKVFMSQGQCGTIQLLDNSQFDGYDVLVIVS